MNHVTKYNHTFTALLAALVGAASLYGADGTQDRDASGAADLTLPTADGLVHATSTGVSVPGHQKDSQAVRSDASISDNLTQAAVFSDRVPRTRSKKAFARLFWIPAQSSGKAWRVHTSSANSQCSIASSTFSARLP